VWKGISRNTGEEVAFKIIVKNDVTVAEANPMHAEILKMVDHKNIIQLKDYFDEEKALCLVLELAAGVCVCVCVCECVSVRMYLCVCVCAPRAHCRCMCMCVCERESVCVQARACTRTHGAE